MTPHIERLAAMTEEGSTIDVWADARAICPDCGHVELHRGCCPYCLSACVPVGGSVWLRHQQEASSDRA